MRGSNGRYVLDATGLPVEEPNLLAWGRWMQTANLLVAVDHVNGLRVSTVFLGLDHQFGKGPPILFETMVFHEGGESTGRMCRYPTREQAERGHAEIVAGIKVL